VLHEQEIKSNVAVGYLAVLLSYLSVTPHIKQQIEARLRGGTMTQLLDAVEEFLHYHRQVAEEIPQANDDLDVKTSFIGRVQSIVDRLKREDGLV
jgi:hypothetical protein